MILTYLKAGAIVALAALLFGGGWYCGGLRSKSAYEALQATQAKAAATTQQTAVADVTAELLRTRSAADAYQKERDDLALAEVPAPVVRLCLSPSAAVPSVPAATSAGESAAAGPGPSVPRANTDVGPALYDLADQYDQLIARLREAQAAR
jgi:hypothetical protein